MNAVARWQGWQAALGTEWTKLASTRATVWTLAVTALLTPVLAVFVGLTGSLRPDDTVLGGSLTGVVTSMIAAAVFGALIVTGEYGSGTMRVTFTACPVRTRVLVAKVTVVGGTLFLAVLPAAAVAYLLGSALLAGQGHRSGDPLPAVFGVALCVAAVGVLATVVGSVLRHSAGAIVAMIGLLLLPGMVAPLFGDGRGAVAGTSPLAVVQKLSQSSDAAPDVVGTLGGWPSLGLLGAVTAALVVLGTRLLERRDA